MNSNSQKRVFLFLLPRWRLRSLCNLPKSLSSQDRVEDEPRLVSFQCPLASCCVHTKSHHFAQTFSMCLFSFWSWTLGLQAQPFIHAADVCWPRWMPVPGISAVPKRKRKCMWNGPKSLGAHTCLEQWKRRCNSISLVCLYTQLWFSQLLVFNFSPLISEK